MNALKELKLHQYIRDLMGQPFEFGKNDCPLLAAGALDSLAGGNRREEMTGLWKDKKSAWVYMKKNGTISEHLKREGCENIDPNFMQNGDFVMMHKDLANHKTWHSVGICLGNKIAIITEDEGVILVQKSQIPVDEVLRWSR